MRKVLFGALLASVGCVAMSAALLLNPTSAVAAGWQQKPAASFALPTPEKIGVFQHPVIFASSDVQVEQLRRSLANVKQKLVVRWGVHVFEVGEAVYTCTTVADCEFEDFIRLATYERCEVKRNTVNCTGLLSGNGGAVENNSPHIHDTFNVEPQRGDSDFDGLPSSDGPTSSEEYTR